MGRKEEAVVPLSGGGELGAHLTQYGQAEVYFHTKKWRLGPSSLLATADMGRKLGAVPLLGRGAGSPTKTLWLGLRPTSMPSFILIYPTVWPQYSNITDRQNKQTVNGLIT